MLFLFCFRHESFILRLSPDVHTGIPLSTRVSDLQFLPDIMSCLPLRLVDFQHVLRFIFLEQKARNINGETSKVDKKSQLWNGPFQGSIGPQLGGIVG
mmetsp:Transcript_12860/g.20816  ORF Transcript_12860/g.20816 Transcript_12860/m.20816 type:complete len:98 (-) Transcript_12860:458-751(-)